MAQQEIEPVHLSAWEYTQETVPRRPEWDFILVMAMIAVQSEDSEKKLVLKMTVHINVGGKDRVKLVSTPWFSCQPYFP